MSLKLNLDQKRLFVKNALNTFALAVLYLGMKGKHAKKLKQICIDT
jgi:hypothetical protein